MNLLMSALAAAFGRDLASAGAHNDTVSGAYGRLKAMLVKKFSLDADIAGLLTSLEADPGSLSRLAMLSDKLTAVHADTLPDLLDAAQSLLDQLNLHGLLARPAAPTITPLDRSEATTSGTATSTAKVENYAVAQVHFVTDRHSNIGLSAARQFDGGRGDLAYGICEVSIPRDHRLGELEAPSLLRFEFRPDPARHVVLLETTLQTADNFFATVSARVRNAPQKNAFVFVHGYNVTFEDAARRTGQMAYDLGFQGAAVFYSWPSQGLLSGYLMDSSNIEWAQAHLKTFLLDFLRGSAAENVYLIGHSMGNRALTRAAAAVLAEQPALAGKLREIILAAPDIDAAVFSNDIAPALAAGKRPVTLYAASDDLALEASEKINGYPRAGDSGAGLVIVSGVETIDASGIDTGFIKHAYFADNRSALSDMYYLITTGARAAGRFGLIEVRTAAGLHWKFKK